MGIHFTWKRRKFTAALTIAISAMVALPVLLLPIGIRNGAPAYILVNRAYAATYPYDPSQDGVLVEDYAKKPTAEVADTTAEAGTGEDGKVDDSGLVQLGAGQTLEATNSDNKPSSYNNVVTATIVSHTDEDNIPVEIIDPSVFLSDDTTYYIKTADTIIKKEPIMSSETVSSISMGKAVTRIGIGDTWSKIRTEDGIEGFVPTYCLSYEMVFIDIDRTVWTTTADLKLRAQANTSSEVLATLNAETQLQCLAVSDKWYKVKTPGGLVGYVYMSYTSTTPPATPTPTPTPTPKPAAAVRSASKSSKGGSTGNVASLPTITGVNGESIVSVCQSLLGVPYVWAGETRGGVDCSGLVVYAYRQVTGYSLPHQTNSLLSSGVGVSYADLVAGDILLWDTDGNGSTSEHAGIYVGGGQVIHASSRLGQVVYGSVDMLPIISIRRVIQ